MTSDEKGVEIPPRQAGKNVVSLLEDIKLRKLMSMHNFFEETDTHIGGISLASLLSDAN